MAQKHNHLSFQMERKVIIKERCGCRPDFNVAFLELIKTLAGRF